MKKRATLFAVVLLVAHLFAVAAQASSPSISTTDLNKITTTESVNRSTGERVNITDLQIPLAGNFAIIIVEDTDHVIDLLAKIQDFLQTKGLPIIEFFDFDETTGISGDGEIKQLIAQLLPEGFDLDTLVMNEFVTLQSFSYSEQIGDVICSFEFATVYEEEQIIVAVIGIFDAQGNVEWIPLEASIEKDVDGVIRVKIYFTQEALVEAGEEPFALAILNE